MSGYLETTRDRPVSKFLDWNVSRGSVFDPTLSSDPITRQEKLLTFRSGARYSSEILGGATPVNGERLLDRASRALGDYGHNFNHEYVEEFTTLPRVSVLLGTTQHYTGPALFVINDSRPPIEPNSPSLLGKTKEELDVAGTSAIAASYPTKPQSDLLVAIAEILREGLPSALFSAITTMGGNSKRQLIRNLSGDYLNYIFGLTPLVREADKLIKAITKMDQFVAQLVADSGHVVRRGRTISEGRLGSYTYRGDQMPDIRLSGGVQSLSYNRAPAIVNQVRDQRVWFSGAFQYWIPGVNTVEKGDSPSNPYGFVGNSDIRQGILGLRATPKAAWNLLPFSWLVDWFVNVGDLLEAADAMNRFGLVMPYGYVMCEDKITTTTTYEFRNTSLAHLGSVSSSIVSTRQQRQRATPYGFGLKDVDISPVQWSILAALGVKASRI